MFENVSHAVISQMKAGVAILIPEKGDSIAEYFSRDKRKLLFFLVIKVSVNQENITILNVLLFTYI